jgi:hypothetical protein
VARTRAPATRSFDGVAHGVDAAGGQLAGVLFDVHAFADQRFEQLGAFALRAVERADAGHPDLLRGLDQRARQVLGARLQLGAAVAGGGGLVAGGLLQLGHEYLQEIGGQRPMQGQSAGPV